MTNIAEILRFAPQGLLLYSPVVGDVEFGLVGSNDRIITRSSFVFDEYGRVIFGDIGRGECLLFPSKEHRTWDNWQNVLFNKDFGNIIVYEEDEKVVLLHYYAADNYNKEGELYSLPERCMKFCRYASTKEREQFFKKLESNGYHWNQEKGELEKIPQEQKKRHSKDGYLTDKQWEEYFKNREAQNDKYDAILQRLDRIYDLLLARLPYNPFKPLTTPPPITDPKQMEVWYNTIKNYL